MATRSIINVKVGNVYHVIYCHNDGYIKHNGKILFNHYNSQELAEKLVSGGNLSILGASMDKPESHDFKNPVKGFCLYYSRDRGDEGCEMSVEEEIVDTQEYLYVWNGNEWRVSGRDYDDISLEEALKEENLI